MRLRGPVALGLVCPAAGLDGARCRDHRRLGPAGRGQAQPWHWQVLPDPGTKPSALEPQAHLSGVLRHEAQPAPGGQPPAPQARARATVRARMPRSRLVGRLHARRLGLRPLVPRLQPARRLQSGGDPHRSRHLDHLGAAGPHLRAHRPGAPAAAGPAHRQRARVPRRGLRVLGQGPWHGDPVHPARKAQPERLYRAVQPHLPRRSAGPVPVRPTRGRARGNLAVPDRLQRAPPPQRPRRHDAGRVPQSPRQNLYFRSVRLTGELTLAPTVLGTLTTQSAINAGRVQAVNNVPTLTASAMATSAGTGAAVGGLFYTGPIAADAAWQLTWNGTPFFETFSPQFSSDKFVGSLAIGAV